jgi:mRNA-degrading endonuclease RelE of RelBE toxin-antitoxin system
VTEDTPERLAIVWSPHARDELRRIDRNSAIEILPCIDRFLIARDGHVRKLNPPFSGFRLRCGDYRVFFDYRQRQEGAAIEITSVRNRREAYR